MSSRSYRRTALAVALAGLAALAAGCGSKGPSATTGSQSAQGGANSDATAAYAYARCMRSHGVSNFPDPKVNISAGHGSVAFAVNPSETGSPKFSSAQKACNGILPAPSNGRVEEQAHKQTLLAFARCLRAHDVQDFPDPNAQGQLRLPSVIAAGVDIHSRTFLDAAEACVGVTHGEITMAQIRAGINGGQ
jgi:hypothetical protein